MSLNFPKTEKIILRYWQKNNTFEKSILNRKKSRNFVFYEGPPTANAKPGIHHVLSRVFKDIICRYKTMHGLKVQRKAGWDTHGLPVELEIEKKVGLKSKKDIEKYGIAKFNKKCKDSVWKYKKDWEKLTKRIAYWLDLENPYITYETEYIESVWWILKEIWRRGLLYQDFKVVPYCPRCGTPLSSHEVAQGYKTIKEPAVYIKFKILNPEFRETSLLIWTTTPWTLPGNVAVALNPDFSYVKVRVGNEFLILAKGLLEKSGVEGEVIKEYKGRDLVGLRYLPPYSPDDALPKTCYIVLAADFVSLDEGTGFVHIAPAFGEEDMELIKAQNLRFKAQNEPEFPILLTVDEEGKFRLEAQKWAGLFVKDADPLIIEDLRNRELLFKEELYEHDYPFCWRCRTPLLYYAKKSWFIKMAKSKKRLLKNNQKINWTPSHLKEGRFGEWLKEVKDWALSRERYWGTPLPIWQCEKCQEVEFIGSLKDLLSQNFSENEYFLFRHGESLRQINKASICWPEKTPCPLTEQGKVEVFKAAQDLKKKNIDLIFSSDLLRTKQSAQIISQVTGAKIIFDKRLREWNVGIFNGKTPDISWQYLESRKNFLSVKLPGGESLIAARKRMYNFLSQINEKYQGKNILIVSHELPLSILEGTLKGLPLAKILESRSKRKMKTGQWRKIEFKNLPLNPQMELDLHRPYIDEIKFYCKKCQNQMKRVPEVIDCWFDAGAMPFGQRHFPFAWPQIQKSKIKIKNYTKRGFQFPADYISEAIDQTRGWFYTLLAISTLLGFGPSYKNVISLGHVLDEKGEKMSKSKGNVVDPWYIIEKYGADATRWYFYTINQPGDSKLFNEKDIEEVLRKFLITFWNCYTFFATYVSKKELQNLGPKVSRSKNILDKWIVADLYKLVFGVTDSLDKFDVTAAARLIENFVINSLSLWYIRRSRKRFHLDTGESRQEAIETLYFTLTTVSKLAAPFIPFLSEKIYQSLSLSPVLLNSVHLEDWPKTKKGLVDQVLLQKMEKAREVVAQALAERAKAKIKVRQTLNNLEINNQELKGEQDLLELIKEEVNVKEITFGNSFKLDTEITPQLKEEGIVREVIRNLQEMRKLAGLKPVQEVLGWFSGTPDLNEILNKNKEVIMTKGKIKDFQLSERTKEKFDFEKEIEIDQQKLWLGIKKV